MESVQRHGGNRVRNPIAAETRAQALFGRSSSHAVQEQIRQFAANAARLVLAVTAFNLTRAAAALTGAPLAKATTATIRRRLINVAARIARSARRIRLHLPVN